ncbi:MAG: UvrB/UvrC motif-containing protein [Pirellula sp.]|nr:UvrB/UvrC motif-containing protein [Pirellula sp.]
MKCQHCEKPATFHITELTEPDGPKVLHLCEEHARVFLSGEGSSPASALSGILAKQLKMDKEAEEIATSDKKTCPVCGITFAEFRKGGRLGCAYDYVVFEEELEPLLINIHGALGHTGKIPTNRKGSPERQRELAQLREEMKKAIKKEEYENASKLRDQIAAIEAGAWSDDDASDAVAGESESFQSDALLDSGSSPQPDADDSASPDDSSPQSDR